MPQHYGSESIVEDFIEQAARVFIRQMAPGSKDALLQVIGIAAGLKHMYVMVRFEEEDVQILELLD